MHTKQIHLKAVTALFITALFIRLLAFWIVPEPHLPDNATIAYLGGAYLLREGNGLSDPTYPVFTPPLYAIVIAVLSSLFGGDQTPIKLAQVLADSFTVIVVYFIAREIFNLRTALLSAAIWALYPFSVYTTIYIGTEAFATFFLSIFCLLTLYAFRSQKWQYYCGAGALLGLATLTRGTTQFFPLVFLFLLFVFHKLSKQVVLNYVVFCLSFIMVIFPWSLRNYIVLGDFIPVATAGSVFLWGSSEKFLTIDERTKELPVYFEMLRTKGIEGPQKGSTPLQNNKFLIRAGIENYKSSLQNDPLGLILFLVNKFFRVWYATESGKNHGIILGLNALFYPLAVIGIAFAWARKRESAWLLLSLLAYFVMLHWISFPLFRYMVPVMPYVITFAAFSVTTLWEEGRFNCLGFGSDGHVRSVLKRNVEI